MSVKVELILLFFNRKCEGAAREITQLEGHSMFAFLRILTYSAHVYEAEDTKLWW